MIRLAVVASHPIQYQAPLYRTLATRTDVVLKVFFCWDFGVTQQVDPGFGRPVKWDVPLLDGYDFAFLRNWSRRAGTKHFWGLVNPGVVAAIREFRADAVVAHGYAHATELGLYAACRALGIPTLIRAESNLLPRRPLPVRAAKWLGLRGTFRAIDGALAIGSLSRTYLQHYGMRGDRIFLAPYSVDNDFFFQRAAEAEQTARELRQKTGIGSALTVVFAAKLIAVKACSDLIRAFATGAPPGARLAIVGDGPLRGELESLARSLGVEAVFLGFMNQSQMPAAYALGDVFVLPSRYEPWGLAVNEAMAMGRPVIVSDQVGAAPDLVGSDNGWSFPAGDVEALAKVLRRALGPDGDLVSRGMASRQRIRRWGIPETAEGYVRGATSVAAVAQPAS